MQNVYERLAVKLGEHGHATIRNEAKQFREKFPEIISRSREKFETVFRIPFTYFPSFPTPVVSEQIDRSRDCPVTSREFIDSLVDLVPKSLSGEDVLCFSENLFQQFFSNLNESFTVFRILFLLCVLATIKMTSETSCNGLLTRASDIRIGSHNQPRFKLTVLELEQLEAWFVCEYLFNSREIV